MSQQILQQPAFELRLSDQVAMSFQLIPTGSFQMGSRGEDADEEPTHTVRIRQPFYLGTFPVTQAQFEVWTQAAEVEHENEFPGKPDHPAENMDWNQASSFCDWLNVLKVPKGRQEITWGASPRCYTQVSPNPIHLAWMVNKF